MSISEKRALNCRLGFLDQLVQVTLMRIADGDNSQTSYLGYLLTQRQQAEELLQSAS